MAEASRRRTVEVAESTEALAEEDKAVWDGALEHYKATLIGKDLLFDSQMVKLKASLWTEKPDEQDSDTNVQELLPPNWDEVLDVYRRNFWTKHDRQNRTWCAIVERFKQVEERGAEKISELLNGEWPEQPIRVDVMPYSYWTGAYTTNAPLHVSMSSTDEDLKGLAAMETLWHEACHSYELEGPVRSAVDTAFQDAGKEFGPENLWHAVIFYTSGEVSKRMFAEVGFEKNYVPYAEANGLYENVRGWKEYKQALDQHWLRYVNGQTSRKAAFADVAKDLTAQKE